MSARNEDFLFAQEAQNKGYVSEEQVEEAFLLQKKMAEDLQIDERLAVILVKRGWLAEEQARRVYALIEPEGQRTQIQGYRLVERIGRGAMGTVYKAIHLGLHRVVAIKVLRPELLAEKVHSERLKSEAQMLASLDHPNIVRAFDAGESNGFPYVVMEYVEGETLKEKIARDGPIPENEALRITRCIADALERARRMGVVHRDVKPGNILISKKGEPKLMDLGLARGPVDLELTQHGATVGTPQFMSPEQIEDAGKVDTRSDIYSLGATLYAMLTGRPPHTGATMTEILTRVLNEQPLAVRHHNMRVSPETSYLVERMMLKDATLRYQTPAQVVDDIDQITGGQSIVPDGFTGNWEAWLLRQRMRRIKRVTLGAAIVLIFVALGTYLVLAARTRQEARGNVDQIAGDALVTVPEVSDSIENARRKLLDVRQAIDRIRARLDSAGIDDGVPQELQKRERQLTAYVGEFERFHRLEGECSQLVRDRRYAAALARSTGQVFEPGYLAIVQLQNALSARITHESEADWHRIREDVRRRSFTELASVVTTFREYDEALRGGDFVTSDATGIAAARADAKSLADHAQVIDAAVRTFLAGYEPDRVQDLLEKNALAQLAGMLAVDAKRLRVTCSAPWEGDRWHPALARKPLAAYCEDQLEALTARVRRQVHEFWAAVRQEAVDLVGNGRVLKAVGVLDRFVSGAGTAYPDLVDEAERLIAKLREQVSAQEVEAEKREEGAIRAILAALREGNVSRAQHAALAAAEAATEPEFARRADQLRHLIRVYESLCDSALEALSKGSRKPAEVRLVDKPDGSEDRRQRWKLERIDGRKVVARDEQYRRGEERNITDFHLRQLCAWAGQSVGAFEDRDGALLALLALPERPDDLRPVQSALRDISDVLRDAEEVDLFNDHVYERITRVGREQDDREGVATNWFKLAIENYSDGFFADAAERFEGFLDPDNHTVRYTTYFDLQEAQARALLAKARAESSKRQLDGWLRGVRAAKGKYGATTLRINFDLEEVVLGLFRFGFGRLIRQPPTPGGVETTPEPTPAGHFQLELLPEVESLLPGRPLSLDSPFDPAHPITVEFDLQTRRGAFFLAIDIDGVQLGILSADPAWHREWILPPDLRQDGLDDVAFYSRGRGIAVHEGAGFGDVTGEKWTWALRQGAQNRASWGGKDELTGELFAFVPGRSYRVRLRRERDRLVLAVADLGRYHALRGQDRENVFRDVFEIQKPVWKNHGKTSDVAKDMGHGTGMIQILSWSNVVIDDLDLTGVIRDSWIEAQKQKDEDEKKKGK